MSTAEIHMPDEEIAEFLARSKLDGLYVYGSEGAQHGICPFVTFYIHHTREDYLALADKCLDIWTKFQTIMDRPFKRIFKSRTQVWLKAGDRRLPTDLRAEAKWLFDRERPFFIKGTTDESPDESPLWSFAAYVTESNYQDYSTVKMLFSRKWYTSFAPDRALWKQFVRDCVATLQPEQCYMGYEVGNGGLGVMGSYEAEVVERISADHFFGVDIDHPFKMGFQDHNNPRGWVNPTGLGAGLRPPTWCFMLSPYWRRRLGLSIWEVEAALNHPRIRITRVPYARSAQFNPEGEPGLWIELGELDLYPVENDVPELLVRANRLIRPVRCNYLNLLSLDPWDDDPNPRFDYVSSQQWMARFDEDSRWPSAKFRRPPKPPAPPPAQTLAAYAGDPCPRTGEWFAPRLNNRTQHVERGQPMPGPMDTATGAVVWYMRVTEG